VFFLSRLYSRRESENIFFKGGTALHLIFKAPRFSEDLDFTVELEEKEFLNFIWQLFRDLSKEEAVEFRQWKSYSV
jgi:predicted nucleotidyltransferase component of viral defense system